VRRGRTDLAETLWQSSNPYKDERTLGDQWLEAKGKQRADGPEMRRGRRVTFSSNTPLMLYAFAGLRACVRVCVCVCAQPTSTCVALGIVLLPCGDVW
jgi:hypothetical protein